MTKIIFEKDIFVPECIFLSYIYKKSVSLQFKQNPHHMKKLFVTFFLMSGLVACAQVKTGAETTLMKLLTNDSKNSPAFSSHLQNQIAFEKKDNTIIVRLLAKVTEDFDAQQLQNQGITVGSQIDNIVTLRAPLDKLEVLDNNKTILCYQLSHRMSPTLNDVRYDTGTDTVHEGGAGLPYPVNGEGVIIGITDWGFDYTHPNFRKTVGVNAPVDSNFRILRAWDHFRKEGPAPEGFDYGTEIVGCEDLMAYGGDTSNLYGYNSHGTHVAGIAAGRGTLAGYSGQAPKAELLMCSFGLNESDWIDAVTWMKHVADQEGKRLVINSSWGMYSFNALDGKSLLSLAINAFSLQGVVFVTSAGNNGDVNFHISQTFNDSITDTLKTTAEWYSGGIGQALIMWGEEGQPFKASFGLYKDDTLVASRWFDVTESNGSGAMSHYLVTRNNDTVPYNVIWEKANPQCQRPHIQINVSKASSYQLHMFVAASDSANFSTPNTVHVWNVCLLENEAGNMGNAFRANGHRGYKNGDYFYGIGEPACADQAISVAAHSADRILPNGTFREGSIAYFSSFGPALGGGLKPEISAPGVNVVSSISSFTDEHYQAVNEASIFYQGKLYIYSKMSGTSMSSPAVTGIVALMLSANPYLSVQQVREILFEHARTDSHTGDISSTGWSNRWGYGKADAINAVHQALLGIDRPDKSDMPLVAYPNPTHGNVTILTANARPLQMQVFDACGRIVMQGTVCGESVINTSHWNRGVYVLRLQDGRTAKIMVL